MSHSAAPALCCSKTCHGSAKLAVSELASESCAEWREDELFAELPAALRGEVAGVLLLGTLRSIPTFAECDPSEMPTALPALCDQQSFIECFHA